MLVDESRGLTLPNGNNLSLPVLTEQSPNEWWRTPDALPYMLDAQSSILDRVPFLNDPYAQQVLNRFGIQGISDFTNGFDGFFSPFYIQYSVNGFVFDGIIQADHTSRNKITSHPVQTGANITDHAFVEPSELSMTIAMSDVMADKVEGQFGQGDGRSKKAFEVLMEIKNSRVPMQVVTRLKTYENMLIESIEVQDDNKTVYGLLANVNFKEILVASVSEVKISARPQTTDSTNRGDLQPESVDTNQSILVQMGGRGTRGSNSGSII